MSVSADFAVVRELGFAPGFASSFSTQPSAINSRASTVKKALRSSPFLTKIVGSLDKCVNYLKLLSSGTVDNLIDLLMKPNGIMEQLAKDPKSLSKKLPPQVALKILKTLGVKKTLGVTSKGNIYSF